jgi:Cu(I)/Ag(I) efflux system membrane fusion protein
VGANRIWVELEDREGRPIDGADVEVKVHMHAMGAMPAMGGMASVAPQGEGTYRADFDLEMGSTWLVEIEADTREGSLRAEGSLTVGTPGLRLRAAGAAERTEPSEAAPPMEGHPAEFSVEQARLQRIGVRTALVEDAELEMTLRAVGRVVYDESALEDVSLKVAGWIGKLEANALGIRVEKDAVLFTLYSPELYAAQQEYLQALASQSAAHETAAPDRADYLVRAARRRLELWDVAGRDLDRIARRDAPMEHVPIRAPISGFVIEKSVVEGSAVEPGMRLLRIAPLERVWVEADVYESELSMVGIGQSARVTLAYLPGRTYEGTVSYVYPYLAGATRTARVRVELENPGLELRPDMYANVELAASMGRRLLVPESAVLFAGDRRFVFLDLGGGRFRPQQVEVGMRSGDKVEILSGLEPGQRIVASGTFLIASESRLRAALEQW